MSHRPTQPQPRPGGLGEDDMVLFIVGAVVLMAVLGSAGVIWADGLTWLIEHRVILPTEQDPLLPLPGCGGAGLDGPRLAIVAGTVAILLATALSYARRARLRSRGTR